nr:response regulator transcription factor [Trichocoleus sp. FACHB-90]
MVADDHSVVAQGLVALLECEADITVVGQACDGCQAVELFRQHQPDIMLMDLRMPQMDGVAAITAICTEFDDARIIVLTTYDSDENIGVADHRDESAAGVPDFSSLIRRNHSVIQQRRNSSNPP